MNFLPSSKFSIDVFLLTVYVGPQQNNAAVIKEQVNDDLTQNTYTSTTVQQRHMCKWQKQ
jgi:hypothetical protein